MRLAMRTLLILDLSAPQGLSRALVFNSQYNLSGVKVEVILNLWADRKPTILPIQPGQWKASRQRKASAQIKFGAPNLRFSCCPLHPRVTAQGTRRFNFPENVERSPPVTRAPQQKIQSIASMSRRKRKARAVCVLVRCVHWGVQHLRQPRLHCITDRLLTGCPRLVICFLATPHTTCRKPFFQPPPNAML